MREITMVKASGAIHVTHKITLRQQQIWNILLAHAYNDLEIKNKISIFVKKILQTLDLNATRWTNIKRNLKNLCKKEVSFNILKKDKDQSWGTFALLKTVEIEDGICTYSYDPRLQKLLYKPKLYTKINISVQNKFKSKYSLFLYELACDCKDAGQTPWIDKYTLKEYLGLDISQYPNFGIFNRDVIKKAIREINEKSDLSVCVELSYVSDWVDSIKLIVASKSSS